MVFLSWLIRYGHVVFAALWIGGYMLLAFEAIPDLTENPQRAERIVSLVRLLTYVGTLVVGFGIVLITRTRGFDHLIGSAWGACVFGGMVIAVSLLGLGDGMLRPALLSLSPQGIQRARQGAIGGFILTIVAVGLMTGATFVR